MPGPPAKANGQPAFVHTMDSTALLDTLLTKLTAQLAGERRFPISTYRVQFHAGFTFQDASQMVPYLHELGITDLYASPYLKARPASPHGYDIVDHRTLNPEIGTEADYARLIQELQTRGMGQLLDIVPNHMGIVGNENAWWNDVLENGPSSPYAGFFDIDWYPVKPTLHEKVLLPVLGEPYGQALESQQIQLRFESGTFTVHYFEHRFPVAPRSVTQILGLRLPELEAALGKDSADFMEYQSILTSISHLPPRTVTDPDKIAERQREKEVGKRRLAALVESSPLVRAFIEENVTLCNGRAGDSRSFDLLDRVLDDQPYRLAFWRVASDEINYRRFFDINELAALSMEKPEVFAATHELMLRLLGEGKVTGVRIDHPDGLYDPKQYLDRLQQHYLLERARTLARRQPDFQEADWPALEAALLLAVAKHQEGGLPVSGVSLRRPLYIVAEKILEPDEALPRDWPVYGTTGYTFANMVNGIFVDSANAGAFSRFYHRLTSMDPSFTGYVYDKKFLILQVSLSSELHVLAHQLDRLAHKNRWSRDFTLNGLRHALREIIACFPVYRSYIRDGVVHDSDRRYVQIAVARAKHKNPAISASLFHFVRDMLLLRYPDAASEEDRAEQRRFVGKFQQVTGPVMAKGLEDTAFYVYNRLVSLNEVGGDPGRFGVETAEFHRYNLGRQKDYPYALSATSTHDTKRSEDVRARINVLSEMPKEWHKAVSRWNRLNKRFRVQLDEVTAPDRNDEYLLYQTLVGAWPLGSPTRAEQAGFVQRIQQYMQKAIHEAKVHTSWINPNPAYDDAVTQFVARILDERKNRRFLQGFREFQRRVSHYGLLNALSQTLIKLAAPGVPDIYQGTELWDLSLVDPDNRRPVDFELRRRLLQELTSASAAGGANLPDFTRQLAESKEDGRIKLYVTYRTLHCRRQHPRLFSSGTYHGVEAEGGKQAHVCAFLRRADSSTALVVVPRLLSRLLASADHLPCGPEVWQDTCLRLPGVAPETRWRNLFTAEVLMASDQGGHTSLAMAEILAQFPVALLIAEEAQGGDGRV